MAKKESTFLNMVITLFVVTMCAALALGGIYIATKEPIALAQEAKTEAALKAVVASDVTFDATEQVKHGVADGDTIRLNKLLSNGELVAYAVETFSRNGYDPTPIKIMVGFSLDGKITGTSLISHKETPGLGTKLGEPKFADQFIGKDPKTFSLVVKKDGGEVDAITAATISSRAFCEAIESALELLNKEGGNN